MKHLYSIALFLAFWLLTGCQKSIGEEEANGTGAQGAASATSISDEMKAAALTISQAQQVANGTPICVKGYIVAATERSINNVNYNAPFEGTSAIVLASKPSDGSYDQFYAEDLFPICLTDAVKSIRDNYNLPANPQYWNQFAYISGTKEDYLSLPGMKKVKAIEIDPNHVEKGDEGGTNNDDENTGNNGENPGDEGPGDEGNNSGNNSSDNGEGTSSGDDGGQQNDDVLTVAQAKKLTSPTRDITMQGYIVAATGYGMEYCIFQEPFNEDFNTYIVLADKPYDASKTPSQQFDIATYTDLFPVRLGAKTKALWKKLNLFQNPQLHNKILRVKGTAIFQLGTMGLDDVDADYTIIEQQ